MKNSMGILMGTTGNPSAKRILASGLNSGEGTIHRPVDFSQSPAARGKIERLKRRKIF
jgi:hypothetical protein